MTCVRHFPNSVFARAIIFAASALFTGASGRTVPAGTPDASPVAVHNAVDDRECNRRAETAASRKVRERGDVLCGHGYVEDFQERLSDRSARGGRRDSNVTRKHRQAYVESVEAEVTT